MALRIDWRHEEGATAVAFAAVLVALLTVVAMTVSAGTAYVARRQMQTAADAAALAGVRELPGSPTAAMSVARTYAGANRAGALNIEPVVSATFGANDTIRVRVTDPTVTFDMGGLLGRSSGAAGASAVAVVKSPTSYGYGVMPFGVMSRNASDTSAFGYSFGATVTLKQPAGRGSTGNYQFVDLVGDVDEQGGGSPDIYGPIGAGGVTEQVSVGETYYTQRGINGRQVSNRLGALIGGDTHTFDHVVRMQADGVALISDKDCPRLILCPIIVGQNTRTGAWDVYNWVDDNVTRVKILTFAWFFIEGYGATGNDSFVTGRFIRPVSPDEATAWGAIDPLGAIAYKLDQ